MKLISQAKRFLQYGLGHFPFFHKQYIYYHNGNHFKELYRTIQHHEGWNREQIRSYQDAQFVQIFRHALTHVPFYKENYGKLGLNQSNVRSLDDIWKLPLVNKNIVKNQAQLFKSRNFQEYNPSETKTSGSTGTPLTFFIDEACYDLAAAIEWRHLHWAGCRFHSKTAILEWPLGWHKGFIDTTQLFELDATQRRLKINSALLNDKNLSEICRTLKTFQPDHIRTFPGLAVLLAQYLKANDIAIRPQGISVRSEKLYPNQRSFLEEVFACPCYELYGQWEFVTFAADCAYHHLHTFFELGYTEIIKNGRLCEEGEVGELVCTQLNNYSMPLIRYKTGDLGSIRKSHCACGREMPILEIVGSRGKDLVVTKKGYFNVQSSLGTILNSVKSFHQIQFYQDSLDHLEVRIVRKENFRNTEIEKVQSLVSSYFSDSIKVSISFVDEIKRTPAGKYHYVESKVPISF